MTLHTLATAALYWYLRAQGQASMTYDTAATVLGCTLAELQGLELDERLKTTPKRIKLGEEKAARAKWWTADDEREVFDCWVAVTGRPANVTKLTKERLGLIQSAFRAGYTKQQQCWAIEGLGKSDWHMGRNAKTNGKRYDELKYALKDGATIEERMEQAGHGRQAPQQTSPSTSFGAPSQVDDQIHAALYEAKDYFAVLDLLVVSPHSVVEEWVPRVAGFFGRPKDEVRQRVAMMREE